MSFTRQLVLNSITAPFRWFFAHIIISIEVSIIFIEMEQYFIHTTDFFRLDVTLPYKTKDLAGKCNENPKPAFV